MIDKVGIDVVPEHPNPDSLPATPAMVGDEPEAVENADEREGFDDIAWKAYESAWDRWSSGWRLEFFSIHHFR